MNETTKSFATWQDIVNRLYWPVVEFFDSLEGLEGEFKTEVVAMEAGGNSTITEHEFELGEEE